MSQEFNEMGANVSGFGGEAEMNITETFKEYI